MDSPRVLSLLEQLDDEIDDLEEAISPLVQAPLSESSSKLPLLDKAKLYVLVTYAIESILFSYLRLHGVKAREHPVFRELTRVKQYFGKIKVAEAPVDQGAEKTKTLNLDKGAARRIIAAGLSGNDKYDLERAEQKAKERARAHVKFTELSEQTKQDELSKKRKAEEEVQEQDQNSSGSDSGSGSEPLVEVIEAVSVPTLYKSKKRKSGEGKSLDSSEPTSSVSSPAAQAEKKEKGVKMKKTRRKSKKIRFDAET